MSVERTNEKTGRVRADALVVVQPLVEYQQNEITKDGRQEDDLWDELEQDVDATPEKPASTQTTDVQNIVISSLHITKKKRIIRNNNKYTQKKNEYIILEQNLSNRIIILQVCKSTICGRLDHAPAAAR